MAEEQRGDAPQPPPLITTQSFHEESNKFVLKGHNLMDIPGAIHLHQTSPQKPCQLSPHHPLETKSRTFSEPSKQDNPPQHPLIPFPTQPDPHPCRHPFFLINVSRSCSSSASRFLVPPPIALTHLSLANVRNLLCDFLGTDESEEPATTQAEEARLGAQDDTEAPADATATTTDAADATPDADAAADAADAATPAEAGTDDTADAADAAPSTRFDEDLAE
ncbi:hypothetical protein E2C01_005725 [Portunus trituberculatus]|uniref:Uncharacterized protein n=1 Tax=Portunus trituberculatus TaxID=210409 RepID=A0A5B7CT51_PORTR|nr:hypothetical protein [Portunus trituberculatus]